MTPPRDPAAAFTYGGTGGRPPPAPRGSSAGEDAPGIGGETEAEEAEAIREPAAAQKKRVRWVLSRSRRNSAAKHPEM
jgi:hypothetical protein